LLKIQCGGGEQAGIIYFTTNQHTIFMELDYKARLKIFGFDVAIIVIILGGFLLGINYYNSTTGTYCESSAQCKLNCPAGPFNDKFINIYFGPFGKVDCRDGLTAVCDAGRCRTFDVHSANSKEDCEKINEEFNEFLCYRTLAEKKNQTLLCREIERDADKSRCYFEFSKILGDLRLCSKIGDEKSRDVCINGLIEAPPEYIEQDPYRGDCEKRPPYTVCLRFSDGFTWLVFDSIVQTESVELDGPKVEVGRGKKQDYYHILYTDFVKTVEKS
jgi:hypothetical protein